MHNSGVGGMRSLLLLLEVVMFVGIVPWQLGDVQSILGVGLFSVVVWCGFVFGVVVGVVVVVVFVVFVVVVVVVVV